MSRCLLCTQLVDGSGHCVSVFAFPVSVELLVSSEFTANVKDTEAVRPVEEIKKENTHTHLIINFLSYPSMLMGVDANKYSVHCLFFVCFKRILFSLTQLQNRLLNLFSAF